LDDNADINRAWENIRENIRTSAKESFCYYESVQHKSCLTKTAQNYFISEAG